MLGLEHPARGCVKVFGEDINKASSDQLQQLRNHWGMLFQQGALYSALTVFDNVAQPMRELRVLPEALIHDAVLLKMNMHVIAIGPTHEVIEVDHPFIKQFFLGDRGKRALAVLDEKQAAAKAALPGDDAGTDKKAET
eukprot:gene18421-22046_t